MFVFIQSFFFFFYLDGGTFGLLRILEFHLKPTTKQFLNRVNCVNVNYKSYWLSEQKSI